MNINQRWLALKNSKNQSDRDKALSIVESRILIENFWVENKTFLK